ncbi:MAG: DUF1599 domain-containing protein [Bacteroidales bacterium]|nr:DUF1599 domain-containing protein [Bacteroidales bacterium]
MPDTNLEYEEIIALCKDIFIKKMKDYGTAWRILRTPSLTDQIYIKAQRIRSLETKKVQKVDEGIVPEFIGIINYALIALIQLELGISENVDLEHEKAENLYLKYFRKSKELMMNKNHDYDEAWRSMRISSFTDLILMKIFRTKEIENNDGKTLISENVDANYYDMINYAVFALIKMLIEK